MSNIGKNLEPVNTSPDQFGQVYDASKDLTDGNAPSPLQSKLDHSASDVDSSPQSQHHTLGTNRAQASYGDHIHDGVTSKKLGAMKMDPAGNVTIPNFTLTGSKGDNVALTNLLTFLQLHFNFTDNTT